MTHIETPPWRSAGLRGPAPWALAWLGGTAVGLWAWPDGDPVRAATLAVLAGVVGLGLATVRRRAGNTGAPAGIRAAAAMAAVVLAAAAATQARMADRVADRLDPALESRDIRLVGTVASLPARTAGGQRFVLAVESASTRDGPLRVGTDLPRQVSLGWFAGWHDTAAAPAGPRPDARAGDRRTFVVRLRQPHGARNPHGFDLERHLFAQGVRATGPVRSALPAAAADRAVAHPVAQARQSVRDDIVDRLGDGRAAGVLAALVVGDGSAIARDDWTLFRDTGVAHLMAISGLHVTMFAWAAGGVARVAWRRSPRAMLWLPAPTAARLLGLGAALAYAVFSGWGVPAQRTVGLLAIVTLLAAAGRRWPWPSSLALAGAAVVVADPWALLDVGFWLSFVAVALLMAAGPSLDRPAVVAAVGGAAPLPADGTLRGLGTALPGLVRDAWRTQWVCTVGLAPLTLVLFQQVSLVGLAANLLAVPWVTGVVTPLAMLGVVLPPAWTLGAAAVEAMAVVLQLLATLPGATWTAAAVGWPVQVAGLIGGLLAVAPVPWSWRLAAVPLLLPLLWPAVPRPPEGRFDLVVLDVGQGTSVLVRTRRHLLVYDAGPTIGRDGDAGERVVRPVLRARGERRIDHLVLSHRDLDHVGGAAALIDAVPVDTLSSSLEPGHPLLRRAADRGARLQRCGAGQAWTWDGVRFEVLHPAAVPASGPADGAGAPGRTAPGPDLPPDFGGVRVPGTDGRTNDRSCVLRVSAAVGGAGGPDAVLLTGDIEAAAEAALLARDRAALAVPVVIVPHHGSRTSSTPAFVAATGARWAVVQAGHRSRFGHPAPDVVARWRAAGAAVVATPHCGAWSWSARQDAPTCERERSRRHWQHPGAPLP